MAESACVTREIASWQGVPFTPPLTCDTCRILMDVYAPTETGPWPLVVIVPGGPMPIDQVRGYTDDFALAIADRGAVVMTANLRQSNALADVACAVGVARAKGAAYGADPARLVLVGHSLGASPVALLGLTPMPEPPDAAACDSTSGPLRPDAIVVIAGLYGFYPESLAADASPGEHIPMVVAQGGADEDSRVRSARSFQEALAGSGWDSELVEVPTADHPGILYEPAVIDAVLDLATRD
jgi:acetyl esterase/lipase